MRKKVALILIYNHRFDKNIIKLEQLYKDRFSNIYHLVPFYDGDKANVISVYYNSYYFQGYLAQGFKHYFNEEFVHYFFVADDLILNPAINENNYHEYFNLQETSSFIPEVYSLHNINNTTLDCYPATIKEYVKRYRNKDINKWNWCRVKEAYEYSPKQNGIESEKQLPDYAEALALLEQHGVTIAPLKYADVFGGPKKLPGLKGLLTNTKYIIEHEFLRKEYNLKYPLAASYSDIVVVSQHCIKKFIQYCGVFAATQLFVELAIPTALLFSTDQVVTEPKIGKRGVIFWPFSKRKKQAYEVEMSRYDYKLSNLLSLFPQEKLYIHPIKLSKWQSELT